MVANRYIFDLYWLNVVITYRLDSMMTGLQDIHWTECSIAQCMF